MRKPKWKNIGILFLTLGLLGYTIFAIIRFSHKDDNKVCNKLIITIKDSDQFQFVTPTDIRQTLIENKIKLKGKKISSIKTQSVEKLLLQKIPVISKIDCYKTPSSDINIDVWQREPILRVCSSANYYVDATGRLLPVTSKFVAYVPIVTGVVNKQFAATKLKDFVLYLRKNDFWNAQIEQIDIDSVQEIVLIPRVGDQEIELGTLDDYQKKLDKLKTFYLDGLNKIGWGNYKTISLKYKNQVVCTKK